MMDTAVREFVTEKTKELLAAGSCCADLKAAANAWLEAAGTEEEAAKTKAYLAELEEDVSGIDALIGLAESPRGAQIFGADAPKVAAAGKEAKAKGEKYCICDACQAGAAILAKKDEMLK